MSADFGRAPNRLLVGATFGVLLGMFISGAATACQLTRMSETASTLLASPPLDLSWYSTVAFVRILENPAPRSRSKPVRWRQPAVVEAVVKGPIAIGETIYLTPVTWNCVIGSIPASGTGYVVGWAQRPIQIDGWRKAILTMRAAIDPAGHSESYVSPDPYLLMQVQTRPDMPAAPAVK